MMIHKSFEMRKANPKSKNNKRKANFEKLLTDTVENVFSSLGESCKQTIYFHLENHYNINKRDIATRIEDFAEALEEMFGTAATLIEIKIMRELFSKVQTFKYSPKQNALSFTNYLKKLSHS